MDKIFFNRFCSSRLWGVFLVFVALFISCIPYVFQIGFLPIIQWDESRLAMNALHMYYEGDWGITYFDGEPDLWNTKPPLMIWLQVIFMHIMGPTEKAIRMPSVLAAIGSNLLLFWAARKVYGNSLSGLIAAFTLAVLPLYLMIHATRTGDYDALLNFFILAFVLFTYFFCEAYKAQKFPLAYRYLYAAALALSLAALTKGVHPMMAVPPVLAYVIYQLRQGSIFRDKHFYIALILFLAVVAWWYVGRELRSAGYLRAVWENELGGRYLASQDYNLYTSTFYVTEYWENQPWLWIFSGLALIWGLFNNTRKSVLFVLYLLLVIVGYTFIVSMAKTRLWWYALLTFPLAALVVGSLGHSIWQQLRLKFKASQAAVAASLIFVFVFSIPYSSIMTKIFDRTYDPRYNYWSTVMGRHLRYMISFDSEELRTQFPKKIIFPTEHDYERTFLRFYLVQLERKGYKATFVNREDLEAGDWAIVLGPGEAEYIYNNYEVEHVEPYEIPIRNIRIVARKESESH